jgi:hypothetical protein
MNEKMYNSINVMFQYVHIFLQQHSATAAAAILYEIESNLPSIYVQFMYIRLVIIHKTAA